MPNFCLQYDLSITNGNVNGFRRQRVYAFIDRYLQNRGCQRYQHSCWRRDGVTGVWFHFRMLGLANAVEAQFGVGAWQSIHYEQRFNLVQVR